jgi:hypothetical protein
MFSLAQRSRDVPQSHGVADLVLHFEPFNQVVDVQYRRVVAVFGLPEQLASVPRFRANRFVNITDKRCWFHYDNG